MIVRELLDVLIDCEADDEVHVALDLAGPDSVSFHHVREVHATEENGVQLVVYEAHELYDAPADLARCLLGGEPVALGASGLTVAAPLSVPLG